MLCSAVSGSQRFSLSVLLGTFCNWSWRSTQRAPSLPPFTSRLVPSAPVLHCQLPYRRTNPPSKDRDDSGVRSAASSLWVLKRYFSVVGRTLWSAQGFSSTIWTYLRHLWQISSGHSCLNVFNEMFKEFAIPAAVTSSSTNTCWFLYTVLMPPYLVSDLVAAH